MKARSDLWKIAAHWNGAPTPSACLRDETDEPTVHHLTAPTMAELGLQWTVSTQLVRYLAALAFSAPFHGAKLLGRADTIWGTLGPVIFIGLGVILGWIGGSHFGERRTSVLSQSCHSWGDVERAVDAAAGDRWRSGWQGAAERGSQKRANRSHCQCCI